MAWNIRESFESPPVLQQTVAAFVEKHRLETPVRIRLLDLSSEAGELSKEYLKVTDYGRETFDGPTDDWEDEMGDVLFSLACLANSTNVNLETALRRSLEKYEDRLRRGGDVGSGG